MLFSKSFGYALRGILYVAMRNREKSMVQLDEISSELNVPRYFMGKIMNRLVRHELLDSVKGHNGGYSIQPIKLDLSLSQLCDMMGDIQNSDKCVLDFKHCDSKNPCPLHHRIVSFRQEWQSILSNTTIKDLLDKDQPELLKQIIKR